MERKVKRLVKKVKEYLEDRYGSENIEVILYGSHARGDAGEESDIDLLVVVAEGLNPKLVRDALSELLLDILLETGELVSVIVLTREFFESRRYPFILNVKREGLRV